MLDRIDNPLAFQSQALKLRAQRAELLAGNIANADTPGYKAVDLDFAKALAAATSAAAASGQARGGAPEVQERPAAKTSLDGNTVDLDTERVNFADNALRYEATLRFLNGKLKTYLSAIQG